MTENLRRGSDISQRNPGVLSKLTFSELPGSKSSRSGSKSMCCRLDFWELRLERFLLIKDACKGSCPNCKESCSREVNVQLVF